MCADGRCAEVSEELRTLLGEKRQELARRLSGMRFLDQHMAHLVGQLDAGATPRSLMNLERRRSMPLRCDDCCCEQHCCGCGTK
jgi:hypothetical protein